MLIQMACMWQVVGVAQTFCEVWETVAGIVAELDVLLGFAHLAVSAPTPYVRPQMLPPQDGEIVLTGCRYSPPFLPLQPSFSDPSCVYLQNDLTALL